MLCLRLAFTIFVTFASSVRCVQDTSVCREEISTQKGRTFMVTFSTLLSTSDFKGIIYIGSHSSGSVNITKHIGNSSTSDVRKISPGVNEISISTSALVQTSDGKQTKVLQIESTVDIAVHMAGYSSNVAAAYTVFPERAWSTKYVVPSFKPYLAEDVAIISSLKQSTMIRISNTKLKYTINTTIQGDESYALVKTDDISGTTVQSNTPVSLVSASTCANVPEKIIACDPLLDSPIPVEYWASEFIVPPLTPKLGYLVRVFAEDSNGTVNIMLKNKTQTINQTFTGMYEALFGTDGLIIISDRKINVVQYCLGHDYDHIDGDPFMASVPAIQHYSNDYIIPTPFASDGFINTIAITIRRKHLSGLLLDGQPIDLQTAKTIVPVQPFDDFRIISLNLTSGSHNLSHPSSDATFSVLLYGRKKYNGFGLNLGFSFNKEVKVCENGGFCTGSTICQCLEGYTGDRCQFDIDECLDASTCRNGATCINTAGNFTCLCSDGWNGRHCETDVDECMNASACQHGGTCSNTIGSYSCHCSDGWTGHRCEIDTDECLNGSTCQNGATCFNNPGSYTCRFHCSEGWTDEPCKTAIPTCFACDYTSSLSFCDSIEHCTGNQTCYLQSFTNTHGHTHYRSGCTDTQTCRQHEHDASSDDTCLHCCNEDFCNSHGCGDNGFPPEQSRGPLCLDCTHVSDPKECDQITMCSSDEMCRIEELPWGDNSIYHLGCASVHDCAVESSSLGRRSSNYLMSRSVPVCTECCHGDFCNQNCTRKGHNQQQIIVG